MSTFFRFLVVCILISKSTSTNNYIHCDESISRYQYEFHQNLAYIPVKNVSVDQYWTSLNFTFIYNDTNPSSVDEIIITTCNNVTSLRVLLSIYDDNMTKVAHQISEQTMIDKPERGNYYCPFPILWKTIKTTSLIPNKPYLILLEAGESTRPWEIVQLDIICNCDCNHKIKQNNIVYTDIIIDDTIDIEFDIKFYSLCNSNEICNILHIGSSQYQSLPKLSVNGFDNRFVIEFSNNYQNNVFQINKSINNDGKYHNIKIHIDNNQLLFAYDNVTYLNITNKD
eukprot:292416_1